ncbi:unnamed protein product [Closterium sp. NIES-54]
MVFMMRRSCLLIRSGRVTWLVRLGCLGGCIACVVVWLVAGWSMGSMSMSHIMVNATPSPSLLPSSVSTLPCLPFLPSPLPTHPSPPLQFSESLVAAAQARAAAAAAAAAGGATLPGGDPAAEASDPNRRQVRRPSFLATATLPASTSSTRREWSKHALHAFDFTVHSHTLERPDDLPAARFHYLLSPMQVVLTETRPSLAAFLTNLCAIIGGVFTVAGIVDGMLHGAVRVAKKIQLGKHS